MVELVFLQYSSICPSYQPPDAQLCHTDVSACVLELVLRRHGGVLRAVLQTCAGGHTSRQHLCTTWYSAGTLIAQSYCMITPFAVEILSNWCGTLVSLRDTFYLWQLNLCSLFSKQSKSEGDPLHCDRSAAQCSVWALGDCYQHYRHQPSEWEGLIHDR